MSEFHFDPDGYLALMAEEVPDYARLQDEAAAATADLRVGRLEDALPACPGRTPRASAAGAGTYDLVVSALAVHHLAGPAKAELFGSVAAALRPGGRFVLADLVVPEDPADAVTPIDGVYDVPSSIAEQLDWLRTAGFTAHVAWAQRDSAVLVAEG